MLITRETDYALRILRALSDGKLRTAGTLAREHDIPQAFGYKILKKLEQAGFIVILRGADGGCRLKADLAQVTLYDLLQQVEGNSDICACMAYQQDCPWRNAHGGCSIHSHLSIIQQKLNDELRAHCLAELMERI